MSLATALVACGDGVDPDLGAGRVVTDGSFPAAASSAERFGLGGAPDRARAAAAAPREIDWTTPPAWHEVTPGPFRLARWRIADHPWADCSLSVLPGSGGGLLDNVNRWRSQLGLEAVAAATVEDWPRTEWLGLPAVAFDASGSWSGMSGDAGDQPARMLGWLAIGDQQSVFLKLVGPEELVAAQEPAFAALARSLRRPTPTAAPTPAPTATGGAPVLAWDVPPGWVEGGPRAMRVVTFALGDEPGHECYVSVLGGAAGGVAANVNRWRAQMGQAPLDATGLASLESVPMLGGTGTLCEIEGSFRGQSGEQVERALMLGAIVVLADGQGRPLSTVFVKMTGRRDVIDGEKDAFVDFCRSLRLGHGG